MWSHTEQGGVCVCEQCILTLSSQSQVQETQGRVRWWFSCCFVVLTFRCTVHVALVDDFQVWGLQKRIMNEEPIYAPRPRTNVHRFAQLAICKKIKLLSAIQYCQPSVIHPCPGEHSLMLASHTVGHNLVCRPLLVEFSFPAPLLWPLLPHSPWVCTHWYWWFTCPFFELHSIQKNSSYDI